VSNNNGFSWKLKSGSVTSNQAGQYGIKGVGDSKNTPGSRTESAYWVDLNNNLWIFGGFGYGNQSLEEGFLNDLWMWNGTVWTWISGSTTVNSSGTFNGPNSLTNIPPSRTSSAARDSQGRAYIFGGGGFDQEGNYGNLNDFWKYENGVWTWLTGSAVIPNELGAIGIYGIQGQPSTANTPGGRNELGIWSDSANNIWVYGGSTSNDTFEESFNDVWMFNATSSCWCWMSGNDTADQPGVYPSQGQSNQGFPGARSEHCVWSDTTGTVWLFGGSLEEDEHLNDLWSFNPKTLSWTWISGSSTTNQPGAYGIFGQASHLNTPGARSEQTCWLDANNNLYLFGGYGVGTVLFDDVWKLSWIPVVSSNPIPATTALTNYQSASQSVSSVGVTNLGVKVAVPIIVILVVFAIVGAAIVYWRKKERGKGKFGELKDPESI